MFRERLRKMLANLLPWKESAKMQEVDQQFTQAREQIVEELKKSGLEKGYDELAQRYKRNARKP